MCDQLGFVFFGEQIYIEDFEIPEKRSLPQLLQVITPTPSVTTFDKVEVHLVTVSPAIQTVATECLTPYKRGDILRLG